MKKLIKQALAFVYNAKVHATHTAIKGKKSSGSRDSGTNQGTDWKQGSNTY